VIAAVVDGDVAVAVVDVLVLDREAVGEVLELVEVLVVGKSCWRDSTPYQLRPHCKWTGNSSDTRRSTVGTRSDRR
jgi:hypothetical protein